MRVDRQQLVQILRSRGNDSTAEVAARLLPPEIDLARDKPLLRRCGIDANVLAFLVGTSGSSSRRTTTKMATVRAPARAGQAVREAARCPQCSRGFRSTDAMLDHLSSHLWPAWPAPSSSSRLAVRSMSVGEVDALLAEREQSLQRPRSSRLLRLTLGVVAWLVTSLLAAFLVLTGQPVLGIAVVIAALLIDGFILRSRRRGHSRRGGPSGRQ